MTGGGGNSSSATRLNRRFSSVAAIGDAARLFLIQNALQSNRNIARMALLLAGLPKEVPGSTINRLCGSGLDAVGSAARAIRAGDAKLMIAGGVESMGNRAELGEKAGEVAAVLAARLNLGNAPCWHTARDNIVEFGATLALIVGTLGKIGQDAALLAQTENGALEIAGGGASCAMAHKANPVTAELLVTLARYAAGLSGTFAQALVHENERSGAAWTLEWLTLPPLLFATGTALTSAADLVGRIHFMPSTGKLA